ncbi:DgyrCDS6165 [Dimorphilus gyrociliatus]|uniref:DgyrCDS6165 n=1 Tax=Dimorphilus gyrociliatus TaxID=2664684 RepID=A0A7I8VN10_9ANNE|nr:DgyrCDS6165 [Dimorphilus gyrociliatus]
MSDKEGEAKSKKFNIEIKTVVNDTLRHLDFLRQVEAFPNLFHPNLISESIRRYETCWLPLKKKFPQELLIPPLDVYWVWHIHFLSGQQYFDDCEVIARCPIDHWYPNGLEEEYNCRELARMRWEKMFREPFEINHKNGMWEKFPKRSFESKLKYDIAEAVNHQKHFYYQVSLKHYWDSEFLYNACMRYKNYIHLLAKNSDKTLLPPIDVVLVWRAHMCTTQDYEEDFKDVLETLPSIPINSYFQRNLPEAVEAEKVTRELMKEEFNKEYSVRGGSFRGEAPHSSMSVETEERQAAGRSARFNVKIRSFGIHVNPDLKNVTVKLDLIPRNSGEAEVVSLWKKSTKLSNRPNSWEDHQNSLKSFQFDTIEHEKIRVQLYHGSKIKEPPISEAEVYILDLHYSPDEHQIIQRDGEFKDRYGGEYFGIFHINYVLIPNPVFGAALFEVEDTEFTVREKSNASAWGPIALPLNPPSPDTYTGACSVALHKIFNHSKDETYNVRVLHSVETCMSAIQVRVEDDYQALAHVIGSNQIPLPDQLNNPDFAVTLDPSKKERAILVKDGNGDHSIVIGKWICKPRPRRDHYGRSDPSATAEPSATNPGFLEITIHELRSSQISKIPVPTRRPNGTYDFKISTNEVVIDLKDGTINVFERTQELAANVALGFACGLLFVLCRPKAEVDNNPPERERERNRYDQEYNGYNRGGRRSSFDRDYGDEDEYGRPHRGRGRGGVFQENLVLVRAAGVRAEKVPFKVNRETDDQPGYGPNVTGFIPATKMFDQAGGHMREAFSADSLDVPHHGDFRQFRDDMHQEKKPSGFFSKLAGKIKAPKMSLPEMDDLDMDGAGKFGAKMAGKAFDGAMDEAGMGDFSGAAKMGGKMAGKFGAKMAGKAFDGAMDEAGMGDFAGAAKFGGKKMGKFGAKMAGKAFDGAMDEAGMGDFSGAAKMGGKMAGKFGAKMAGKAFDGAMDEAGMGDFAGAAKFGGKKMGKFGAKMAGKAFDGAMDEAGMGDFSGAAKMGGKMAGKFGAKMAGKAFDGAMDEAGLGDFAGAAKFGGKMGGKAFGAAMSGEMGEFDTGDSGNFFKKGFSKLSKLLKSKPKMDNIGDFDDMAFNEDMRGAAGNFADRLGQEGMRQMRQQYGGPDPDDFEYSSRGGGRQSSPDRMGNRRGESPDRMGNRRESPNRQGRRYDSPNRRNRRVESPDSRDDFRGGFDQNDVQHPGAPRTRTMPNNFAGVEAARIAQRSANRYIQGSLDRREPRDEYEYDDRNNHRGMAEDMGKSLAEDLVGAGLENALEDVPGGQMLADVGGKYGGKLAGKGLSKFGKKGKKEARERSMSPNNRGWDRNRSPPGPNPYDRGGYGNMARRGGEFLGEEGMNAAFDEFGMPGGDIAGKAGGKALGKAGGLFGKFGKKSKKQSSSEDEAPFDPPGAPTGYGRGHYGDFRGGQGNYNPYGRNGHGSPRGYGARSIEHDDYNYRNHAY